VQLTLEHLLMVNNESFASGQQFHQGLEEQIVLFRQHGLSADGGDEEVKVNSG